MEELQVTVAQLAKQIEALENQAYILYLQLNAVTKQLMEKGTLDKDQLTKDMDELNDQLYNIAKETQEEIAAETAE
jgi:polyhydroxyalkanoate synthesis regulator phasin